jgi:TP901-1 family phage major tail protein
MTAYNGALVLLKIFNEQDQTYETIGGLKTTRFVLNKNLVDTTNKNSGNWRELLQGGGITSVAISGGGVFTSSNSERKIKDLAFNGAIHPFNLYFANGDILSGNFLISSYERVGNFNDEEAYNITLESSGSVSYLDK